MLHALKQIKSQTARVLTHGRQTLPIPATLPQRLPWLLRRNLWPLPLSQTLRPRVRFCTVAATA